MFRDNINKPLCALQHIMESINFFRECEGGGAFMRLGLARQRALKMLLAGNTQKASSSYHSWPKRRRDPAIKHEHL